MRRVPLRPAPPADHRAEPGYREWHRPIYGTMRRLRLRGAP